MRAIILNTAALTNEGTRCEAGTEIQIGTGKAEIRSERAAELLGRGLASEEPGSRKSAGSTAASVAD